MLTDHDRDRDDGRRQKWDVPRLRRLAVGSSDKDVTSAREGRYTSGSLQVSYGPS